MILCLDSSSDICSVSLCEETGPVAVKESGVVKSHAALLTLFIDDVLHEQGLKASDLEAVAVTSGPGSYTGLRIGVSTAKGIAYGCSIPLLSVTSLFSLFCGFLSERRATYSFSAGDLFYPMIDARRMEVYSACYNLAGDVVKEIGAEIVNEDLFSSLQYRRLFLFGSGASKCKGVVQGDNICIVDDFLPSAKYMYSSAYQKFNDKRFEDVAYFEPFYLKDFIATKPAKNILNR